MRKRIRQFTVAALIVLLCVGSAAAFEIISKQQEIEIGRDASAELEQKYGLVQDQALLARMNAMGRAVAARSERADLPYSFKILNMKEINALSLPGGFIYITKGLADMGVTDAELANVLGHEVAHASRRHVASQLEKSLGIALVLEYLTKGQSRTQIVYQVIQLLLQSGYSREDEFDADHHGARYSFDARYDPRGMPDFLQRLMKLSSGKQDSLGKFFSTHPETQERIDRLNSYIQELRASNPSWTPLTPSAQPAAPAPTPSPASTPAPTPAKPAPAPTATSAPSAAQPALTLTAPSPAYPVGDDFLIAGRTAPSATVALKVITSTGGPFGYSLESLSTEVKADGTGAFSYRFRNTSFVKGESYTITAVARDTAGRLSKEASVTAKR